MSRVIPKNRTVAESWDLKRVGYRLWGKWWQGNRSSRGRRQRSDAGNWVSGRREAETLVASEGE